MADLSDGLLNQMNVKMNRAMRDVCLSVWQQRLLKRVENALDRDFGPADHRI